MSYYHELYVVCDECHTSLLVDEATYEDADNDAADEGVAGRRRHRRQALLSAPLACQMS